MIMQRRRAEQRSGGYASREAADPAGTGREAGAVAESRAPRRQPQPPSAARGPREVSDPQRVKRLAAVAAASVAVALVAVAYGTWAALSAQAAVEAAGADAEPTVVMRSEMRAGEVLESSSLEVCSVPRALRVEGALGADALEGATSVLGKRILVDLPAGSQLTSAVVAGSAEGSRLSAALASGMQAVTVAVDAESGLAGQLRPSDRVRVVGLEGAASGEAFLSTICDDVRVLALDADRMGSDGAYTSVTLEVSLAQADAVRAAQWAGKVSLVLASALDGPAGEGLAGIGSAESGESLAVEEGTLDG